MKAARRADSDSSAANGTFIGAYTINLIVAEMMVFFGGLAVLLASWPDVPWNGLMYGLAALMVAGPIILYPFSRQLWLALDLVFRPAEPADFESTNALAGPPPDPVTRTHVNARPP